MRAEDEHTEFKFRFFSGIFPQPYAHDLHTILFTLHKKRRKAMEKIMTQKKTAKKQTIKEMKNTKLINKIVETTNDAKEIVPRKAKAYITELQNRFNMLNPYETSILCVFVEKFDSSNNLRDIANHYDISVSAMIEHLGSIDNLVKCKLIRRFKFRGEERYFLSHNVLECLRKDKIMESKSLENLSINEFITEIEEIIERAKNNGMDYDDIYNELNYLIDKNQNLYIAQKFKEYSFCYEDLMLYICMLMRYINQYDDNMQRFDFEEWFPKSTLRLLFSKLDNDISNLIKYNLVEHTNIDGQIEPGTYKLSDYSKEDILQELNLAKPSMSRDNLTHHEDIKEKNLYYNTRVTKEVNKLHDLLNEERMKRVLKRMEEKGMRKGFACLFYGTPGTGKTETVLQLARESKRDIMFVDVPNIRSKWVGDTEKNIKQVFDQYKKLVKNNDQAPILVFNEADAIFTRRNEGGTSGVDKMENAMQNIILQEMENLEGIMIATTNLTGNLDSAFERRFLYKIEFDKPTADERKHIWKSMLPDLTEEQAYNLAKRFDFSGGQIENIARKRIVNDILDDRDDIDINDIIETCDVELLNKKNTAKLGFVR